MKTILATLVASSALTAGVAFTSIMAAAPVQAFSISIDPSFDSTENTGASALLDFNFSQLTNQVQVDLGIKNTTDGTKGLGATAATLVGVAYKGPEVDPEVLNLSSYIPLSSNFTKLWNLTGSPFNPAILAPYGVFDVAISLERQSFEGGNPQGGLKAGESAAVRFIFDTDIAASDFSDALEGAFKNDLVTIVGRFQQVTGGQIIGEGSDKVLGGIKGEPVPEPTSMAASVLAIGGLGFLKKKFQKQKQAT